MLQGLLPQGISDLLSLHLLSTPQPKRKWSAASSVSPYRLLGIQKRSVGKKTIPLQSLQESPNFHPAPTHSPFKASFLLLTATYLSVLPLGLALSLVCCVTCTKSYPISQTHFLICQLTTMTIALIPSESCSERQRGLWVCFGELESSVGD